MIKGRREPAYTLNKREQPATTPAGAEQKIKASGKKRGERSDPPPQNDLKQGPPKRNGKQKPQTVRSFLVTNGKLRKEVTPLKKGREFYISFIT